LTPHQIAIIPIFLFSRVFLIFERWWVFKGFGGFSVFLKKFWHLGCPEAMVEQTEKKKKQEEATKGRRNRWSNGAIGGALVIVLLAVGISWAAAPKINLFSRVDDKPCPCARVSVFA